MKNIENAIELYKNNQKDEAMGLINEAKDANKDSFYQEAQKHLNPSTYNLFVSKTEDVVEFFMHGADVSQYTNGFPSESVVDAVKNYTKEESLSCEMNIKTGQVKFNNSVAGQLVTSLFKKNVFIDIPENEIDLMIAGGIEEMEGEIVVKKESFFAVEPQEKPNFSTKWVSSVLDKVNLFSASLATPRNIAIASIGVSVLSSLMGADANASGADVFHKLSDAHTTEVLNNIQSHVNQVQDIDMAIKLSENTFDAMSGVTGSGKGHFEVQVGGCSVNGNYLYQGSSASMLNMGIQGDKSDTCHQVATEIMKALRQKLTPILKQNQGM